MSVRKRVVKIMREILLQRVRRPGGLSADGSHSAASGSPAAQEEHPSTRDICLALMRRIQDEESVRRLVVDVFQQLLFVPIERHTARLFSGQGDINASLGAFNDELVDFYDSKLRTRVLLIMDMVRLSYTCPCIHLFKCCTSINGFQIFLLLFVVFLKHVHNLNVSN